MKDFAWVLWFGLFLCSCLCLGLSIGKSTFLVIIFSIVALAFLIAMLWDYQKILDKKYPNIPRIEIEKEA